MVKVQFDSDLIDAGPEVALVVQPDIKGSGHRRSLDIKIDEIVGLARAILLTVERTEVLPVTRINAGHFFGSGQRERISDLVKEVQPDILVVNHVLTPVQQRNLEKQWNAKVIDRTGLILEIFGARAQTKEGRLQVELAALEYQRSRLVRSWTHLERQRGGAGFMGGPGNGKLKLTVV